MPSSFLSCMYTDRLTDQQNYQQGHWLNHYISEALTGKYKIKEGKDGNRLGIGLATTQQQPFKFLKIKIYKENKKIHI